ncbi:MazG nucleotide pyrophosphohydrolase domain-containing protein [Curtobacterium sp. MCPF17_002]|uniref:MazG nucleotide pyrophosphohydrolase domain-containing protein n=1 Tax=Curtobacterium sp. MCPF17_002 TaxID=2175645 RepID=UPI001C64AF20|nr:MazG nucleotide pyrophosphohydrolase domain-containing protein [Curtobacterium sp. MCPF17_002]WIB78321.1 MazG nucleotide pyrophosphohydrolase domain-containing protein [Curtobacterium sp. MCPF17_002]
MTAVTDLVAVVDRLLDPAEGCVWNRAQTHASLARYAVEESYELVDAIDSGDDDELREELGDVLYQVVLHAGLAESFDLEDAAADARDKMVRRHPHVFGDERADTVEDVVRVWRAAKAAEKSGRRSLFDGVPRAMPPLERAVKLLERLEERGDADAVVASVVAGAPRSSGADAGAGAGAVTDTDPGADPGAVTDTDPDTDPGAGSGAGSGAVDRAWGAAVLASVAEARNTGIDPIASLRAAVADLEAAGRAEE